MDSTRPGIQYGATADPHRHDDDMVVAPTGPSEQRLHMVQVAPNLEDSPDVRKIEYWAAVENPNGAASIKEVSVTVYPPGSDQARALQMRRVPCSALGDGGAAGTALEAAVHTGQLAAADADNIVEGCTRREKAIYRVEAEFSYHDPYGEYRVVITALDRSGAAGTASSSLDVLPVIGLRADFDYGKLDFGQVIPNTPKRISGDRLFVAPNDRRPTVKNVGNAPAHVNLNFSKMVGAITGKTIDTFEAQLNSENSGPLAADATVSFKHALGADEVGQLDFSIFPRNIPADVYRGTLALWASR